MIQATKNVLSIIALVWVFLPQESRAEIKVCDDLGAKLNVHISSQDASKNSPQLRNRAKDLVEKAFSEKLSLSAIANLILNQLTVESVGIFALPNCLQIKLTYPNMVFALASTHKNHLEVSDKFEVYDTTSQSSDINDGYIVLDLFTGEIRKDRYGRVSVDSIKDKLRQAAELIKKIKQTNWESKQIRYLSHRGFKIESFNDLPEVIVGTEDFEKRLTRLIKLKQNKDLKTIKQIELDFANRAFLKEKQAI